DLMHKARSAQAAYAHFSQSQVDAIVRAIAKVVYDNAEALAKMAVEETRMGVYEDKVAKNKGKSKVIWHDLKDKKSVGILRHLEEEGLVEIAKPIGVIGAVAPTTNPTVTAMSNAMFALKGGNAIIIAPHPRAKNVSRVTVEMMNDAIYPLGAPAHLIQIIEEPSIELTGELMQAVDVVVATGGGAMVKAAYSSGKPAYGVGPGNVQCIIDKDSDYEEAVPKIITGRCFDNGIICSGEQSVIAPAEDLDAILELFKENGAWIAESEADKAKLRQTIFEGGMTAKDVVGQSVATIARLADLPIPVGTRVILAKADGPGEADLLSKEKMCPVMAVYGYHSFDEALSIAQTNLELEGKGHSAALHSHNDAHIQQAGLALTVSRLVVNQPSSTSAGGSLHNGFAPTTTLGCGTWGNNIISENFTYKHMINISRIGYYLKDKPVPTDEAIWAD
ncbi:succinate-semialdehyde dehydrogenase, partial [Anoxynatronum buryatiense]